MKPTHKLNFFSLLVERSWWNGMVCALSPSTTNNFLMALWRANKSCVCWGAYRGSASLGAPLHSQTKLHWMSFFPCGQSFHSIQGLLCSFRSFFYSFISIHLIEFVCWRQLLFAERHGRPRPITAQPNCQSTKLNLHEFQWGQPSLFIPQKDKSFYSILNTAGAALPSTNFFSSARPLGRTSWKEKKCCCWAAAVHQFFPQQSKKLTFFLYFGNNWFTLLL